MPDHVHILVQLPATIAVADFVRDLKTATNVYLKENRDSFPKFDGWSRSYCALTYSQNEKDTIINYIKNQKEHHKRVSFRDELLGMLRESGVEVDMKYFMVD
jgi:REP element-mobilizing transposase RayT